jgi:heme-degrading monooxygenase HmoA
MIARVWSGIAGADGSERYESHFRDSVLPHLESVDGFRGAYLMRRDVDGAVELQVLTLWTSLDHIRAFTGEDTTTAVVEPAARAALTSYDTTVELFEIVERV